MFYQELPVTFDIRVHINKSFEFSIIPWIWSCLINPSSAFTAICNVTQDTICQEHCHQQTVITAHKKLHFSNFIKWFTDPLKNSIYVRSLFDSSIGCYTWTVDHFSQTVQQFFSVIIKVSVNFIDGPIFYHPQCAFSFSYQALIVRNYNYTCWKNIVNYIPNLCTLHAIYLLTHPLSVSLKAAWQ